MVYVVLALGFIVGVYALMRFFLKANSQQIKLVITICAVILYSFILLFFALSGRIVISILLLIPFVMIFAQRYIIKKQGEDQIPDDHQDPDQD